ncbi:hypothetical protein TEA_018910 [Camellia sinensis var. sinensis]|uniref:Trafficking protein particle complex subunit 2 n=1 Tax=Camellia sinensis var. sinensis TaxID=542762 RepID=A0A4S4EF04_CAMSN|nr:hypothetical protein TEA_018910 [Camellia sinensis var. sinensis]
MPLGDGFGFDWGVEFGPIEGKHWGVELSLVRLAKSDYIGTGTLTYRIQADTCRESAATDVKFVLTGILEGFDLGLRFGMIVCRNDIPIYEAEVGAAVKKEEAAHQHQFILHAALDIVQDLAWTTSAMFLKAVDRFNDLVVSVYVTAGHILHIF